MKKIILLAIVLCFYMVLNAKTGNVQYFFNSPNSAPLNDSTFLPTIYYSEMRFYDTYQYTFIQNNVLATAVNFNEIIITNV